MAPIPPVMSRLDRYVISESLAPVFLGFLVATFLLLIRAFFDLAEAIIRQGVPAPTVLKLLGLNLPHIVVITIPMGLLFGILVAIGRLSADSELTALRAAGVSLFYLYRGLLTLSGLVTLLNIALMLWLMPWGNQSYRRLLLEQMTGNVQEAVEPRVFNEILEDKTLYVFETPPGERAWHGVFLADALPVGEVAFTVADRGTARVQDRGTRLEVQLHSAIEQRLDLEAPTEARITSHQTLTFIDEDPMADSLRRSQSSQVRELYWSELLDWARDEERPASMRALARVELHKKFSIPAACLVFGFLALPLGFSRRPGERSSAFAQSIAVIAIYYVLENIGEEAAANARLSPALAMWLPNALFLLGGVVLLARKNSDKSLLLTRVHDWLRALAVRHLHLLRTRRQSRTAAGVEASAAQAPRRRAAATEPHSATRRVRITVQMPQTRLRFPSRIDRYILRLFTRVAVIVFFAALTIYIVVDLTELARSVLANEITASMLIEHYEFFALQILYTVAPLGVLLTTLVTFGLLSRTREVTAAKALGVSLYRLAVPVIAASALVGAGIALLDFFVLPVTNARQAELRRVIKGYEEPAGVRRATRQWFFAQAEDGGAFVYNYLHFNPQLRILQRFQAFRFDPRHRLTGHLYASELRRVGASWVLGDGWARTFAGPRIVEYEELPGPVLLDLPQGPEFFSTEVKSSQEMNYLELREYVARISSSGQRVPDLETQLHAKLATPVVCVVMVLVALPFAFRLGRQGALYGVGLAILLAIVLYIVMAFFTTLGEASILPPWVAAWGPNILFSLLSLYLFLGVRT